MSANIQERGETDQAVVRMTDSLVALGIQEHVISVFKAKGIYFREVLGSTRYAPVAEARHWLMMVIRQVSGWSYPYIAMLFNRDHTTVMNGEVKAINRRPLYAAIPLLDKPIADLAREQIALQLQRRADRLKKTCHPAAAEVKKIANSIQRGEGLE